MKMTKILVVCVGLCLAALALGAITRNSVGEGEEMPVAAAGEQREAEIPAIDVVAPAETATATFALG